MTAGRRSRSPGRRRTSGTTPTRPSGSRSPTPAAGSRPAAWPGSATRGTPTPAIPRARRRPVPGTRSTTAPSSSTPTSGSLDLAAEGQGCNTVNVEAWDNMGLQSGDVTDGPLCYDTVAPKITTAPTVALQNKVGPVGSTVPVTVSWNGTDATSGVNHYTLYESKNGGSFTGRPRATKSEAVEPRAGTHVQVRGHRNGQRRQHECRQGGHHLHADAAPGELERDHVLGRLDAPGRDRRQRRRRRLRDGRGEDGDAVVHRHARSPGCRPRAPTGARRRSSGSRQPPDREHERQLPRSRRRSWTWSRRRPGRTSWSSRCSAPPGIRGSTSTPSSSCPEPPSVTVRSRTVLKTARRLEVGEVHSLVTLPSRRQPSAVTVSVSDSARTARCPLVPAA